ncbi:MAG: MFS transporter [Actinomycetia bacterium]|nr:MFS transporter [Actinomycetes bacterium]
MVASIPRGRYTHIIPVAFLMYTIAFMDRLNIGMALPYMAKDLHFSPTIAGLVSGILFVGYLFFQMPGGHLAERWSAKKFVLVALFVWGAFAMLTGFVRTVPELLVVRFLVGVAEGGVWPATLVLLAHWFPREERARARNLWILCLPVASVIQAPLSGWLLTVSNWHWLFVIEGLLPWVWAIAWALFISDWPRTARWISAEERAYIEAAIAAERDDREHKEYNTLGRALKTKEAWIYAVAYICQAIPGYGIAFFLPSLLKKAGMPIGEVGVFTAMPFAMAIVGLLVHGWLSDRSLKRRIHVIVPILILGVGVLASSLTQGIPALSIALLIAAGWGLYAFLGPFWTMVEQTFPVETAGPVMGFVNAIGNLGGFFGPLAVGYLVTATGGYEAGFLFLGLAAVLMAVLMSFVRVREGEAARVSPSGRATA